MPKPIEIKCPFCGNPMQVETWKHSTPCQAWTKCGACEAHGPHAYDEQEHRAQEKAIKAMEDYYNSVDAALWRASRRK